MWEFPLLEKSWLGVIWTFSASFLLHPHFSTNYVSSLLRHTLAMPHQHRVIVSVVVSTLWSHCGTWMQKRWTLSLKQIGWLAYGEKWVKKWRLQKIRDCGNSPCFWDAWVHLGMSDNVESVTLNALRSRAKRSARNAQLVTITCVTLSM